MLIRLKGQCFITDALECFQNTAKRDIVGLPRNHCSTLGHIYGYLTNALHPGELFFYQPATGRTGYAFYG